MPALLRSKGCLLCKSLRREAEVSRILGLRRVGCETGLLGTVHHQENLGMTHSSACHKAI